MYKPHYQITDKIVNHLTEIAVAREIVEKARLVPKWEISLRQEATVFEEFTLQFPTFLRNLFHTNDSNQLILPDIY